ncbi:MAG: hypothetical protein Q8N53_12115 [Longimicrobiales bacterium]|nr:hypothetical protein [Longimicrobiales bacterium]
MAASIARAARSVRMSEGGILVLNRAHALAMEPRVAALDDDHHPLFLHPGRTVLILIRDAGCADPGMLAAAALVESEDAEFRTDAAAIRASLGDEVAELVGSVPLARTESLAEVLVTATDPVRMIALAERLDHLRHAHLRDAGREWRVLVHAEAGAVYLPVAMRTHPRLTERYQHWCQAFARRLERE